ncbi:MAG: hypothetical protein ABI383_12105 [Acidobacteriaceae bacterium]
MKIEISFFAAMLLSSGAAIALIGPIPRALTTDMFGLKGRVHVLTAKLEMMSKDLPTMVDGMNGPSIGESCTPCIFDAGGRLLENGMDRYTFSADGRIAEIFEKQSGEKLVYSWSANGLLYTMEEFDAHSKLMAREAGKVDSLQNVTSTVTSTANPDGPAFQMGSAHILVRSDKHSQVVVEKMLNGHERKWERETESPGNYSYAISIDNVPKLTAMFKDHMLVSLWRDPDYKRPWRSVGVENQQEVRYLSLAGKETLKYKSTEFHSGAEFTHNDDELSLNGDLRQRIQKKCSVDATGNWTECLTSSIAPGGQGRPLWRETRSITYY